MKTIFYNSYLLLGGAIGPFDAWLVNRGLRTLPNRMRQHHTDGLAVARFLAEQPQMRKVFHPALADPALVEGPALGILRPVQLRAGYGQLRSRGLVCRSPADLPHRRQLGWSRKPGADSQSEHQCGPTGCPTNSTRHGETLRRSRRSRCPHRRPRSCPCKPLTPGLVGPCRLPPQPSL